MANSADPDQLASSEANWSGSTLFAKQGISGFSRTRVNIFHACKTFLMCLKIAGWLFNSIDPASDLGLRCLLMLFCPNASLYADRPAGENIFRG